MAKLFLIRHAESVANTQGIYQGQTYDTDLSALGQKQATALWRRFQDVPLDAVVTSPLKRTFQTAQGLGVPQVIPDIIETNHGDWEGLSKDQILLRWPDLYQHWLTSPSTTSFPNGEDFVETSTRVISWFNKVMATNLNVAAVTHSNVIMVLLTYLNQAHLDSIWQYTMQPTAVTLVESHSPARIVFTNDISHLIGLKSDLHLHAI